MVPNFWLQSRVCCFLLIAVHLTIVHCLLDGYGLDEVAYPPRFMINRVVIRTECHRESKYYQNQFCKKCQPCCQGAYFATCVNRYNQLDRSRFKNQYWIQDPNCNTLCNPYHSYALASIRCRIRVMQGLSKHFAKYDEFQLDYRSRLCIELSHYFSCMHIWNDLRLYPIDVYHWDSEPICRLVRLQPLYEMFSDPGLCPNCTM